jgi:hypothetical protein
METNKRYWVSTRGILGQPNMNKITTIENGVIHVYMFNQLTKEETLIQRGFEKLK